MHLGFLFETFRTHHDQDALVWRDEVFSYGWLLEAIARWQGRLAEGGIGSNAVVALAAEFSPNATALLLALIDRGAIVVPLTESVRAQEAEFCEIAEVEYLLRIGHDDEADLRPTGRTADHPLLAELKRRRHPGLVLFSSGSTGKSKAAVHDFLPLLEKFKVPRRALRTIGFLLFDHIGGVNTLLYTLANAGCLVTVEERTPEAVCEAIARHRVELLPTSPTFLNLLLLSGAIDRHDLSSLSLITYGTESMPETTLQRLHQALPHVRLQQTYGLSEIGILRSKSRASDSLWMKVGGEGVALRVVDGLLEVKTPSAMLGYLNAPSPFTADGWFRTGDAVEVDGEYVRILGRKSEIINVGGAKVYPAEVEEALQAMPGVESVVVRAAANPITGQMVEAVVKLAVDEPLAEFRKRMRRFLKDRLPAFKVPQKVVLTTESMHGGRFKKLRSLPQ